MKGKYGSAWIWEKNQLGYLVNNRWYCIEQYARMNTPGVEDGNAFWIVAGLCCPAKRAKRVAVGAVAA